MIECFFDCSSPWTYLAFHNVQLLADEFDERISWRPIVVGGIFNSSNPSVYAARADPVPEKWRYMLKDLRDWSRLAGLAIRMPPSIFPVNSVKVMRGCVWLEGRAELLPFARAAFEAYWRDDRDISQDVVLIDLCEGVGIDPADLLAGIATQQVKNQLRANTDELIARGGFGTPTLFLDGADMYFGNDRLPLIRDILLRRKDAGGA